MARIRSVHPGFFSDDRLVPCSAFARLLFVGLGVQMADDKGIFEWKPVTIKMRIFPGDNVDVDALLAELVDADAIRHFEVDGKPYGAIRNFRKYQKPKTPNDVFPIADGITEYVSLPQSSETNSAEQASFPQNGEKQIQREEGGDNRKEPNGSKRAREEIDSEFENDFWPAYPHKVFKGAALKAFRSARGKVSLQTILDGLERYKRSKPGDRAWRNPATFLNGEGWADEPAEAGGKPSSGPIDVDRARLSALENWIRYRRGCHGTTRREGDDGYWPPQADMIRIVGNPPASIEEAREEIERLKRKAA